MSDFVLLGNASNPLIGFEWQSGLIQIPSNQ